MRAAFQFVDAIENTKAFAVEICQHEFAGGFQNAQGFFEHCFPVLKMMQGVQGHHGVKAAGGERQMGRIGVDKPCLA
jgi:hypothetical protein